MTSMRWLAKILNADIWSRQFEIDLKPVWRFVRQRPEAVVLGLGLFLRVAVYVANRGMWLDELSLKANLVEHPVLDFSEPLAHDQLAPLAFLIVQRAIVKILGTSNYAMRLVPLCAGVTGLYLFASLARRILSRQAALVALVLFAVSDDLIHYSSEMKPYSVDLAVGLAITLAAALALANAHAARSTVVLAIAAIVAPWCSFASAFIIAGCGAALLLSCLRSHRFGAALAWVLVGMAWLASFLVSYAISHRLLRPDTTMYRFWDFAFLPLGHWPITVEDLQKAAGILLEVLVNPLNLVPPIWPYAAVILPLLLLAIGVVSLARRSGMTCLLFVLPVVLAMAASALKRYPLHGRLILELIPACLILIAEGTDWLHAHDASPRKLVYKAILVLLLAYPCLSAITNAASPYRKFNAHGDIHNNLFIE
jgi:hypothetical protein